MTTNNRPHQRLIAVDTFPCPECGQEAVLMQLTLQPNPLDPKRPKPLDAHKLCFNCLWHGHFVAGPSGTWVPGGIEKQVRHDGD